MEVTFDQLPLAVSQLHEKLSNIERLLTERKEEPQPEADQLLTVDQCAEFLNLSKPTIYSLISKGEIPVMKRSKRCYFSRTELVQYLKEGRKRTLSETAKEAEIRTKK